jgi:uncharacterized protein YfaS (alpha-2-macroglobulin family)
MSNIEAIYPGDTVVINIEVYTLAGVLYDPTIVVVTIYDPSGTELVTEAAVVNDSVGLYHYDYNVPADGAIGIYTTKPKGTDGARIKFDRDTFEVTAFDTGG